jgi:hypothetical protein
MNFKRITILFFLIYSTSNSANGLKYWVMDEQSKQQFSLIVKSLDFLNGYLIAPPKMDGKNERWAISSISESGEKIRFQYDEGHMKNCTRELTLLYKYDGTQLLAYPKFSEHFR